MRAVRQRGIASLRAARCLLGLAAGGGFGCLRGAEEITLLPPVWVTAARMEPFYLATNGYPARPGSRVWLKTSAGPMANAMYVGFRGERAKDGDEVIRINGRPVKEMKPGEAVGLILGVVSDHEATQLELEVLGQGEKKPRLVTIDRFWAPSAKRPAQKR